MRDYVSVPVLANWVSMLRADVDGALWLSDDDAEARFYERCAHSSGRVVPAPGVAIELLDSVESRRIEGVVATIRSRASTVDRDSVFCPSIGDAASLLIASTTSYRAIVNVCGAAWLTACERELGPVRDRAIWIARMFGNLRKICLEQEIPPLEDSRLSDFLRWDVFEIAWDRVDSTLTGAGLKPGSIEIVRRIPPASNILSGLMECDGMDVVRVLAHATHYYHPRGISAYRVVDDMELLGMLQVSFELSEIEGDLMYWRMRRWERMNPRYALLNQWRSLDPLGIVWDQRYWEADLAGILRFLKPNEPFAALKTDLDNFKAVNDLLGHALGDEAIRLYCRIFKRVFQKAGDVYRRGGDEVIALAPGVDRYTAERLAEELRVNVEADFRAWSSKQGLSTPPTASIGLVLADSKTSASEVIALLDDALLRAKGLGKNRVVPLSAPTSGA
jgi:diguanylate cyclase (GGDEF)-like protein